MNCGFPNHVIWWCLVASSLRNPTIFFQGRISFLGIVAMNCGFQNQVELWLSKSGWMVVFGYFLIEKYTILFSGSNFQGQISKKHMCKWYFLMMQPFPKKGTPLFGLAFFGNSLLTVGNNDQQEMAISLSILSISVALLWQYVSLMYLHLSTMSQCENQQWLTSDCNMSCSLLPTVSSHISVTNGYFCGAFFGMALFGK